MPSFNGSIVAKAVCAVQSNFSVIDEEAGVRGIGEVILQERIIAIHNLRADIVKDGISTQALCTMSQQQAGTWHQIDCAVLARRSIRSGNLCIVECLYNRHGLLCLQERIFFRRLQGCASCAGEQIVGIVEGPDSDRIVNCFSHEGEFEVVSHEPAGSQRANALHTDTQDAVGNFDVFCGVSNEVGTIDFN